MSRRAAGWLAIGLFVSLLLNVFLASFLVARLLLPADDDRHGGRYSWIDQWREMAATLPEPQRERALALWDEQQAVWAKAREQRQAAREAANAALLTEPFDEAAMQQAFTMMRSASTDRWDAFRRALLATAGHLPLDQRRAYVEDAIERWEKKDRK